MFELLLTVPIIAEWLILVVETDFYPKYSPSSTFKLLVNLKVYAKSISGFKVSPWKR